MRVGQLDRLGLIGYISTPERSLELLLALLVQVSYLPIILPQDLIQTSLHNLDQQRVHLLHDWREAHRQLTDLQVGLIIQRVADSLRDSRQQNQTICVQGSHDLL